MKRRVKLVGETENYYLKITNVRRHRFRIGLSGYIIEGIFQMKDSEEFIFYFNCQTDLKYETFYSECIRRKSDYYLNVQGLKFDESTTFVNLDEEIIEYVEKVSVKRMRKNVKSIY